MEPKKAIAIAKQHLAELFVDEMTAPPTLEEIWLDERTGEWCVTLGVRRPTNHIEQDWVGAMGAKSRVFPDYKVVRISDTDGKVVSVLNREMVQA